MPATAYRLLELNLLGVPSDAFLWDPLGLPAGRSVSTITADRSPDYLLLTPQPPHTAATARMIEHLRGGSDQAGQSQAAQGNSIDIRDAAPLTAQMSTGPVDCREKANPDAT